MCIRDRSGSEVLLFQGRLVFTENGTPIENTEVRGHIIPETVALEPPFFNSLSAFGSSTTNETGWFTMTSNSSSMAYPRPGLAAFVVEVMGSASAPYSVMTSETGLAQSQNEIWGLNLTDDPSISILGPQPASLPPVGAGVTTDLEGRFMWENLDLSDPSDLDDEISGSSAFTLSLELSLIHISEPTSPY